jgi:hypothetical protein
MNSVAVMCDGKIPAPDHLGRENPVQTRLKEDCKTNISKPTPKSVRRSVIKAKFGIAGHFFARSPGICHLLCTRRPCQNRILA